MENRERALGGYSRQQNPFPDPELSKQVLDSRLDSPFRTLQRSCNPFAGPTIGDSPQDNSLPCRERRRTIGFVEFRRLRGRHCKLRGNTMPGAQKIH